MDRIIVSGETAVVVGEMHADITAGGARKTLASRFGALASGRSAQAAARRAAQADPDGYAQSQLAELAPDPASLDTQAIAAAIRNGGLFATDILRAGLTHLASAITALFAAMGVRRFIIMGGFALAVGPPYASLLTEEIERLGCVGLTDAAGSRAA
ncbi:hypothetical protein OHT17_03575 [Streptomyces sp. NBC_00371]|uniref:hypothetical protein n=1 Tax=unclassified Streptomyces TaxID=2593676 RepID=UPI002E2598D7